MRPTLAIAVVAATIAAVSTEDCNPSYNVPSSGACFTNCNINAGNSFLSGWTMDHTSSKFIPSLTLMCNKGTSEYLAFMSKAGMCMASCPEAPELFNTEFAGACAWWAAHKDDVCGGSANASSGSASASASGSASASASSNAAQSSSTVVDKAAAASSAGQISANIQNLAIALAAGAVFLTL